MKLGTTRDDNNQHRNLNQQRFLDNISYSLYSQVKPAGILYSDQQKARTMPDQILFSSLNITEKRTFDTINRP